MSAGRRVVGSLPGTYARHVGRVGALAVALGIGVAVALPGVAYAETGAPDPGSNTANETPSGNPTPDESPSGPTPKDDEGKAGVNHPTDNIEDDAFNDETLGNSGGFDEQIDGDDDDDDDDLPVFNSPADEHLEDELDPQSTPDELPPVEPVSQLPITPTDPIKTVDTSSPVLTGGASQDSTDIQDGSTTQSLVQVDDPLNEGSDDLEGLTYDQPTFRTFIAHREDTFTTSNLLQGNAITALEVAPAAQPQPSFFDSLLAIPGTLVSGVLDVVSALLAPVIGPGGILNSPFLWGALLSVRRQFDQAFANSTPVLQPVQTSQDLDDGQVHGTFGGADVDGDTLTYTVPARGAAGGPTHGTVTINQAAGTWTYTPDDNGTPTNYADDYRGADSFTVTASDASNGFHIHAFGQTHAASAPVAVRVVSVVVDPPAPVDPLHPYTPAPLQPGDPIGTVRGTINATDPQGLPIVYSYDGPATTADGSTVQINSNGSFVYTPSDEARHNAAAGVDTATFTATAANSGGASVDIPVTVPVGPPLNEVPTPPLTSPPHTVDVISGTVISAVGYTDADGDALLYGNPNGSGITWTTNGGGSVTVDPDTGTYAYTPEPADRLNAYTHPDQNTDSFTVTISDGHGSTQTVAVSVPITAAGAVVTGSSAFPPIRGAQNSFVAFSGEDGTTAVIYGTGSSSSPRTAIMVIHPDDSYTSASVDGVAPDEFDRALVGADGTFAVTTYAGTGTLSDPFRSVVTVVRPDGTITTTDPVIGRPLSIASQNDRRVGADGTVVETIFAGTGSEADPYRVTLVVVRPDGQVTTRTIVSYPIHYASVGADGTVALTTLNGAFTAGPHSYTVTVINPDGTSMTSVPIINQIVGNGGAIVANDGTVYQTVRTSDGSTALAVIESDGSVTIEPVAPGTPGDVVVVGQDGTLAQSSYTITFVSDPETGAITRSFETTLTVFHPNGTTTRQSLAGQPLYASLGQDGTFAQIVVVGDGSAENPASTALIVIHPDGTSTLTDYYPGQPVYSGTRSNVVTVGVDGTAAIRVISFTGDSEDPYRNVLLVIHPDGSITSDESPDLYNGLVGVGEDGTVAHVTQRYEAGVTMATIGVIRPDGGKLQIPVDSNLGSHSVAVGADGTVYVTSSGYDNDLNLVRTVVTVVHSDGDITRVPLSGSADGPVAFSDNGTVRQVTYTAFFSGNAILTRNYLVSSIAVAESPAPITV